MVRGEAEEEEEDEAKGGKMVTVTDRAGSGRRAPGFR